MPLPFRRTGVMLRWPGLQGRAVLCYAVPCCSSLPLSRQGYSAHWLLTPREYAVLRCAVCLPGSVCRALLLLCTARVTLPLTAHPEGSVVCYAALCAHHAVRCTSCMARVHPGLMERVCVAHLLAGYLQRQPALVRSAQALLSRLPASGEVLVMRGVAELLLGSVQGSVQALRDAEVASLTRWVGLWVCWVKGPLACGALAHLSVPSVAG